jgi:hypothetical protein
MRIGSNKNRDICGICGGDGSTCNNKYAWTLESTATCSETCGGGRFFKYFIFILNLCNYKKNQKLFFQCKIQKKYNTNQNIKKPNQRYLLIKRFTH